MKPLCLGATILLLACSYSGQAQLNSGPDARFGLGAKGTSDGLLAIISNDITAKTQALGKAGVSDAVKSRLAGELSALNIRNDLNALSCAYHLLDKEPKITPLQINLAGEIANLTSAYAVQRNLGPLDGSLLEISNIVNELRLNHTNVGGLIRKVLTNPKLTYPQKQILTALATRYR